MPAVKTIILPYVQTRPRWTGDWTTRSYLDPDRFISSIMPTVPTASFSYPYGRISNAGAAFANVAALTSSILGHYVRIMRQATPSDLPIWHGVIMESQAAIGDDDVLSGGSAIPTGDEGLTAYGLEVLLDRCTIDGSVIYAPGGGGSERVDARLPFNLYDPGAETIIGNRSNSRFEGPGGKESYVFDPDGSSAAVWTAADVAEYLVAQFGPPELALELYGSAAIANLALVSGCWEAPRTVAAGLNAVISRSRGHSWRIIVDPSGNPLVQVLSCFGSAVTVNGVTINPAAVQITVDGDADAIEEVVIGKSTRHGYDRVIARGSPIVLMGTFYRNSDGPNLAAAWGGPAETAYKAASDQGRTAEKYEQVYSHFRCTNVPAGPACSDAGVLSGTATGPVTHGKRLLRQLPMRRKDDDASGPREYRAPLVMIKGSAGGVDIYAPVDGHFFIGGRRLSAGMGVRLLDGEMGLAIRPGPLNHVLALNHWTGAAASAIAPRFDHDELLATVAWCSDEHLKVASNIASGPVLAAGRRILTIDVPEAQAWYRLDNTVTDVVAGGLVEEANGAELRNDKTLLATVCAMAKSWYGRERSACKLTWRMLDYTFAPGDFLSNITRAVGNIAVNCIVSAIQWDAVEGMTTLVTDFEELDFKEIASPGRRGQRALPVPPLSSPQSMEQTAVRLPRLDESGGVMKIGRITDSAHENGSGTGHATDPSTRWSYTIQPLKKTGAWDDTGAGWADDGSTITAYNLAEAANTVVATDIQGNGVKLSELDSDGDSDYDFHLRPVPTGSLVWYWAENYDASGTLTTEYWFDRVNGIGGACP
jgi:hypothetical protein